MPEEQERFHNAVAAMLNSVMFENWLRFYFLREDEVSEGKYVLSIAIPEKALDRIRERFFEFYPMAEELNGRELTLDVSRSAVCNFIRDTYEGSGTPTRAISFRKGPCPPISTPMPSRSACSFSTSGFRPTSRVLSKTSSTLPTGRTPLPSGVPQTRPRRSARN